jgi:hypothetical protein
MLEAEITGVIEALGNLTERGATDPVVKATVSLSESGFVSVQDAIAFGEIKDDTITGMEVLFGWDPMTLLMCRRQVERLFWRGKFVIHSRRDGVSRRYSAS